MFKEDTDANLQLGSEVYFKLQEAEREAEMTGKRYSPNEVMQAMKKVVDFNKNINIK